MALNLAKRVWWQESRETPGPLFRRDTVPNPSRNYQRISNNNEPVVLSLPVVVAPLHFFFFTMEVLLRHDSGSHREFVTEYFVNSVVIIQANTFVLYANDGPKSEGTCRNNAEQFICG
ncbi:hypothetical protein TcasGA2_TC006083 [Tribolium castaneum]|uniref:Uncharacterized protein n=1 Tax=Tribolium castaneum TaxID=7070 RepID=D6WYN5_TRICA|nr:hypothetical protein TcasGA2_TC006083 [Tribolium castaneum]